MRKAGQGQGETQAKGWLLAAARPGAGRELGRGPGPRSLGVTWAQVRNAALGPTHRDPVNQGGSPSKLYDPGTLMQAQCENRAPENAGAAAKLSGEAPACRNTEH